MDSLRSTLLKPGPWKIICCLFLVTNLAQSQSLSYRHLGVKEGLPSMEVYQIKQDRSGYLWFATDRGVCRFNGQEVEVFDHRHGFETSVIFGMTEDRNGKMWFHGLENAIFYFDGRRFVPHPENQQLNKKNSKLIHSLSFDEQNRGIASGNYQPLSFDTLNLEFEKYDNNGTKVILKVVKEQLRYNILFPKEPTRRISIKMENDSAYVLELNGNLIYRFSAIRAESGLIYLANDNFIYSVNEQGILNYYVLPGRITISLFEDRSGNVWVGTEGNGAFLFKEGDLSRTPKRFLKSHSVSSIHQDHEERYWFSTLNAGVFYLRSQYIKHMDEQQVSNSFATALTEESGSLYVGFKSGSVGTIEFTSPSYTFQEIFNQQGEVNDLVFIDENREPTATSNKLYNPEIKEVKEYYSKFLLPSGDGKYLTISHEKVMEVRNDTIIRSIPYKVLWGLRGAYLNDSTVLFATTNGLQKLDLLRFEIKDFAEVPTLKQRLNDLEILNQDSILLGSPTEGLMLLVLDKDGGQRLHHLTGSSINRIYRDGQSIWLATDNGIEKWKISNGIYFNYKLTVSDGLNSNRVNDLISLRDTIWAATDFGINYFPKAIPKPLAPKPIIGIRKITLNGAASSPENIGDLGYGEYNLNLHFEAISFLHPHEQLISYRFTGESGPDWIKASSMQLDLVEIKPGENILEYKADTGRVSQFLSITMAKPYWQKWWFWLLVALSGFGLSIALNRILVSRQDRRRREELMQQKLELTEAKNRLNLIQEANLKQEIKQVNESLEQKKNELTAMAVEISRKSQTLEAVKDSLSSNSEDLSAGVKQTLRLLKEEQSAQKEWQRFMEMFSRVHPRFEESIRAKHPNLSQRNMRLLMLIKLGLSSFEISKVLGISPQSVNKSRYRLRRKLELNQSLSLENYLKQF